MRYYPGGDHDKGKRLATSLSAVPSNIGLTQSEYNFQGPVILEVDCKSEKELHRHNMTCPNSVADILTARNGP